MKKLIKQFARFGIVGVSAFLVEYVTLFLLTEYALPLLFPAFTEGRCALIASPIAFTLSTVYNYILSVKWVFVKRTDTSGKQTFVIFVILSVIALGLNQVIMTVFIKHWNIHYLISKVVATFLVMIYNFISRKIFIEDHTSLEDTTDTAP